ncbi:MAG: hypothetical protein WDW38_006572 [Sanguina aurantia]
MSSFPTRSQVFLSAGRGASSAPRPSADLEFMAVSWHASDNVSISEGGDSEEVSDDDGDGDGAKKAAYVAREYMVKAFGVTQEGISVGLTITGFKPYFYVRVERSWGSRAGSKLKKFLLAQKGSGWEVAEAQLVCRKDYLGFQNGEATEFVRIKFAQQFALRQLAKRLSDPSVDLRSEGIHHRGALKLYESNIDPLLRLMHHQRVSPAGWVRVKAGGWSANGAGAPTTCEVDVACAWTDLEGVDRDEIAPLVVFSLDIECGSSHGDFPQAKKGLNKLGMELVQAYTHTGMRVQPLESQMQEMVLLLESALGTRPTDPGTDSMRTHVHVSGVFLKRPPSPAELTALLPDLARAILTEVRVTKKMERSAIERVTDVLDRYLPAPPTRRGPGPAPAWGSAPPDPPGVLVGDPVIQIGVAMHVNGDKSCCQRHILTLGTCAKFAGTVVHEYEDEGSLLLGFTELMRMSDPDVLIGYNQFGFDFAYLNGRSEELGVADAFSKMGRLRGVSCNYKKQTLSSSALGDNELRYFEVTGRCQVDIMKVVQRDHKLDSYKLDAVAEHFMGMNKNDITPTDIFRLQLGTAEDRRVIAEYCVQDCALCNHLLMRLEILANNVAMANVCSVPLSFIFLRGQGIKVQSLVAKRCLEEGFLIPTIHFQGVTKEGPGQGQGQGQGQEEGYEGAIVLEPEIGMYLTEPVTVLDFASLYPSCMISGNLSHDTIVMDAKYDNLRGVDYEEVRYDVRDEKGVRIREEVCRFAKTTTGILPMILRDLLSARKSTRARIKTLGKGGDAFMLAVLDGQQLAFKVTANSLYGQMGARTSPLYLKQIAACTTAIGRAMIMKAKTFLETEHKARVIYGDTDSVFAVFPNLDPVTGEALRGRAALQASIAEGIRASKAFGAHLPAPHDLEYEKTFFPFFLLSKKRYVGKKFEMSVEADKSEVSSMGLVTKRRDNAPIVKTIYGGLIEILLERQDLPEAERFLEQKLAELVGGQVAMEELVVSKALKGFYKAPDTIAHYVLARRMGERDPGNKPQVNERVPYVYIVAPRKLLQGERIENPEYVKKHGILVDTTHYVTNQIMKPVLQLMSLALEGLTGFHKDKALAKELAAVTRSGGDVAAFREAAVQKLLFDPILESRGVLALEKTRVRMGAKRDNQLLGQRELTEFFHMR